MNWLSTGLLRSLIPIALFLSPIANGEVTTGDAREQTAANEAEITETIETSVPDSQVVAKELSLVIKVGGASYDVGVAENAADSGYWQLPANEKEIFGRNRMLFLEAVAKGLGFLKYGIGIGAVTKDKAVYIARKLRRLETNQVEQAQFGLSERSEKVVLAVLRGLDRKLFESAPIIARANEFGIVAAGGVEALGGRSAKGWGGLLDLGISIGFNRDTRALVIQIFRDVETYHSSVMPAIALGGLVAKAGFYAANQHDQLVESGKSFYPPMVPGFEMTTDRFAMFGFSSGLTWPPSPIGDILTYTNRLDHARILRLTFSPFLRGFVRIQSSLPQTGLRDLRMILESVPKAARALSAAAARVAGRPRLACERIFAEAP